MKVKEPHILIIAIVIVAIAIIVTAVNLNNRSTMTIMDEPMIGNPYSWVTSYTTPQDNLVIDYTETALNAQGYYGHGLTTTDIYALQEWVSSNIRYETKNPGDMPYMPNRTLTIKHGNCFDMTSLLYSMMLHEQSNGNSGLVKDMYIILVNVTQERLHVRHCAVLTIISSGIIISDPTIAAWAIDDICMLNSPSNALYTMVDETTIDSYIVDTAVNMDDFYTFPSNNDFIYFCEEEMRG